jgi:nuclear pore complex protein Nup210
MGKKGYMVLLDGINSGSAKVIVRLPYNEYKTVPEVEVDITVLANLIIEPVDVNILVADSINFRVLQLKQGKLHEITLGEQYYLEIENNSFAKITSSGLATGLALGTTGVVLRDRNVIESSVKTPMPKARLTVCEAEKITLSLLPYRNWVTVENEKHAIAIDLYTKNDERIVLGSKYKMESSFDANLFKEATRNSNGSRIFGEAVKAGTSQVTGSFLDVSEHILIY